MILPRALSPFLATASLAFVFGAVTLAPAVALADVSTHVADIAAKGSIPRAVPVEAGLGLGMAAALLAVGMERRARR